jgi:hypothetical protein
MTPPTITDIERIGALEDPALRNLQITQCYHELALVLAERTGREANWCTFATWASKQAGQTIRKEDLERSLSVVLGERSGAQAASQILAVARRVGIRLKIEKLLELMWKAVDPGAAFTRSSEAVARGNRKVFVEIGYEFARFYRDCLPGDRYDEGVISRFCEELRPGDPPDGQEGLRRAFRHYYQALFETQAKARSELLLLANILIGQHEQTRLQPEINEALEAPVITPQAFTRNLVNAYYPQGGWQANAVLILLHNFGKLVGFDEIVAGYVDAARREAQHLVTEMMMTIELSHGRRLRLGRDLTAGFPPALQQIANPELRALLAAVDPTPDSTQQSGADFWGDLPDRLHFILELFRCYHSTVDLYEPPFSSEQVAALIAGRMPEGRL